jgi:hypothetical protein
MGLTGSRQNREQNAVDDFVKMCSSTSAVGTTTEDDFLDIFSSECHVVNACSTSGKLALIAALDAGNETAVHWILSDPFVNLRINNRSEEEGRTALMAACAASRSLGVAALHTILSKWGNCLKYTEQDDVNHWSALHYCAYHGHVEAATMLLNAEEEYTPAAEPGLASLLDHYGQSPLHIAASRGHVDVLQLLLTVCYSGRNARAGTVGVRSRDQEGYSAIDLADSTVSSSSSSGGSLLTDNDPFEGEGKEEDEEDAEEEGYSGGKDVKVKTDGSSEGKVKRAAEVDADAVRDVMLKHEMLLLGGTEC